ncbi:MAG: citrate lyase beta subunit [Ignavibacteriae bacterium]|nr:citrate lyase beta subunit [Ignavibacteriota bacterium]
MNTLEKKMVEILKELAGEYFATGIKAEFEAEGTRLEEAMRLKDVISKAGLDLNLKIGGSEAIKDMLDSISLGVSRIIAPMVETPYALKKYIESAYSTYSRNDCNDVEFLINVETKTTLENLPEMLSSEAAKKLQGIVIGRVDLTGSMGLTRENVNDKIILEASIGAAKLAKKYGKSVIVGGGVSVDSIEFFNSFPENHLDRYETRKVIFACPDALKNPKIAFLKANEFELLWLKNKKNFYGSVYIEDDKRISMLEERYNAGMANLKK